MPERPLASWIARHDNGWITLVEDRGDGTWAAWALPEGTPVSGPDYIEMDDVSAKAAAEFALRQKSGHTDCSANCSFWAPHSHSTNA
jgi:hypothetical protein